MKKDLNKIYEPAFFEADIYQRWEDSGFFNPDKMDLPESAPVFTVILPPPNITAKLHIGHSAMLAIEDLVVRYHRQNGYRTLWLPGTDHAAIATQNVVEKKLLAESGKTRHQLGRQNFLHEVDKFVSETQNTILKQTRVMGSSLDWSRLAFTLDAPRQLAVKRMFLDMHREGVIYRGERMVNWCPRCHSTLADDEVEYKEQETKLYTFRYSDDFPIAISTTRPETKLGDVAVAVNPKDERYQRYIGQEFSVNFCGQPLVIKIIADREVEMDFGTGALGVTPAHSAVDWQMAEKNNLPKIKVIDEDGCILDGFGKYSGLEAVIARETVIADLRAAGLMISEEDIKNNISCCYRCDSVIEPLPSKQWFVAVDAPVARLGGLSLKQAALEQFEKGEIDFLPSRFGKRYRDWMENLHDWCISRQIWFGHRIPAWYKEGETYVGEEAPVEDGWEQDSDTLDTWFSSGMWTFSTLGWPDNFVDGKKGGDLARFHPTQFLDTGYEILTLWVSRMIMMSLFALGEKPFSKVYLHGTILDAEGKKMSKSKGNGVDPLDVVSKYGADALRLSLLMGSTPGNDSRYLPERVEAKRNFVNKLWNIARFILSDLGEEDLVFSASDIPNTKTMADRWILRELFAVRFSVAEAMENSDFSLAADNLYDFTWNKLADWYLEIAKIEKDKNEILFFILKNILILWHPFIPFVTEAIWSGFSDKVLMIEQWPNFPLPEMDENKMSFIQETVVAIRNARSEHKVEPAKKIKALVCCGRSSELLDSASLLCGLRTGLSSIEETSSAPKEPSIKVIIGETEVYLMGGIDQAKELARLAKEKEELSKLIAGLETRLGNPDFAERAPLQIVQGEKDKLERYHQELAKINESLSA